MSRLRKALERYVCMRQVLGYEYNSPARRLSDFVSFMEACGAETITVALTMEWVTKIGRHPTWAHSPARRALLCPARRTFRSFDRSTAADLLPAGRRAKPYIYEIEALAAALTLPPANALRRWTYHSLFGLIAVSGLRHSEAPNLHRDDVDLDQALLTIRESKFGKSRMVALHATTLLVLRDYSAGCHAHLAPPRSLYLVLAGQGGRLLHQYVHRVFWRLSRHGPRVHDLRHRFAV